MGAVRSALVGIRRPAIIATAVGATALAAVVSTVGTVLSATVDGTGPGPSTATIAELSAADGWGAGVRNASTLIGAVALAVVAVIVASDFGSSVIRNLLVRLPDRRRLLLGKLAAAGILLTAATLIASLAGLVTALVLAPGNDISTSAWWSGRGVFDAGADVANLLVATLAAGTLGALLAVLARSAGAAIGIGLAWLLPGEALLAGLVDGLDAILPGQRFADLAASGTASLTSPGSLLVTLAVAAAAPAVAVATFTRRDVTA